MILGSLPRVWSKFLDSFGEVLCAMCTLLASMYSVHEGYSLNLSLVVDGWLVLMSISDCQIQ